MNKPVENTRRKDSTPLSPTDKCLEAASLLALLAVVLWPVLCYADLPGLIAVHYNAFGEPDKYGSRDSFILTMSIVGIILYLVSTLVSIYPRFINYPTKVTDENRTALYAYGAHFFRLCKLILMGIPLALTLGAFSPLDHRVVVTFMVGYLLFCVGFFIYGYYRMIMIGK